MRILVIGSGGREHAMLWAMARGGVNPKSDHWFGGVAGLSSGTA